MAGSHRQKRESILTLKGLGLKVWSRPAQTVTCHESHLSTLQIKLD